MTGGVKVDLGLRLQWGPGIPRVSDDSSKDFTNCSEYIIGLLAMTSSP